MDIHRAISNGAAARHGNFDLTATGQKRAEDTNTGPHLANDIIMPNGIINNRCINTEIIVLSLGVYAKTVQEILEYGYIRQVGNALDDGSAWSENRSGHDWKCRILRAADVNSTFEANRACDFKYVHIDFPCKLKG
jgi:hypothetical protein